MHEIYFRYNQMIDGILNIHKAPAMTSHDVVARVRKLLRQKRVGHTGTLDPMATGVLPICVGQATRVAEYLSESGKAYQAQITFGTVTDTYDAEGIVIRTASTDALTLERIENVLPRFLGPQLQVPPLYSAIKIQGQPAYKHARAGEALTLEPRAVEITQLRIVDWQHPKLTLDVECSKGTYIRSLAYDLGEALECGAYLTALLRTRSGPFSIEQSLTLEQLVDAVEQGQIANCLFPTDYALQNYPALHLDEGTAQRVLHGNAFHYESDTGTSPLQHAALARVYDPSGRFLAIAMWDAEYALWQPKKVLL
jgi:tRNA pseudouridine55 synthase